MCAKDHPANRKAKSSARSILPSAVRGIFFKDSFEQLLWDEWTGTTDIDPVRIWLRRIRLTAFNRTSCGLTHGAPLPEERVAANLNGTLLGGELASIIQKVDQNLLDLAGL